MIHIRVPGLRRGVGIRMISGEISNLARIDPSELLPELEYGNVGMITVHVEVVYAIKIEYNISTVLSDAEGIDYIGPGEELRPAMYLHGFVLPFKVVCMGEAVVLPVVIHGDDGYTWIRLLA